MEGDDNRFSPRARFFDQSVGNALCDFPLLIDGTARQHRDLN